MVMDGNLTREGITADLEAMQSDLKAAGDAQAAATQAMSSEKFNEALSQAKIAQAKAAGIVDQVKAAKDKIKGKATKK